MNFQLLKCLITDCFFVLLCCLYKKYSIIFAVVKMVVVAQLVRALVCGAGGRGFESRHPPLILKRLSEKKVFFFGLIFRISSI